MSRSLLILAMLVAAASVPIAVSGRRLATACTDLAHAESQLNRTVDLINRINDLRSRQPQVETHEKPPHAIIAQVNAVLVNIGVDQSVFAGVTPQGDEPYQLGISTGSSPYRAQSVQVILKGLEVRDAVRFLNRWIDRHPIWEPVQIQLTHAGGRNWDDERFNLTMKLRAVYFDASQSTSET